MAKIDRLKNAWREAAIDLRISVQEDFRVSLPNGKTYEFPIHIAGFGREKGTLIAGIEEMSDIDSQAILEESYYVSFLNVMNYQKYDRDHFTEALNDWGWYGPETQRPVWFTGSPHE